MGKFSQRSIYVLRSGVCSPRIIPALHRSVGPRPFGGTDGREATGKYTGHYKALGQLPGMVSLARGPDWRPELLRKQLTSKASDILADFAC